MMQAKDIPEGPILRFLAELPDYPSHPKLRQSGILLGQDFPNDVRRAMPDGTPYKVALAKMAAMIRKGLIEGCACGCRGDFRIPGS
jgi:hypothetical protein